MKKCPNNHENPDDANFCRVCGCRFVDEVNVPFFGAHPEYHLRPFSEFSQLDFFLFRPDYIEDPKLSSKREYYYIVKGGKFGILYWSESKKYKYGIVVKCKYDHIDKEDRMFICYNGSEKVYVDLAGNILK